MAPPSTAAPLTAAPPSTVPATTAPPSTASTGTAPAVSVEPRHQEALQTILSSHLAADEFVGARIAVRDADGTITEVVAGSSSTSATSGAVDPDLPWNIGSITKTYVAVVVLQLAEDGQLDLDAPIESFMPQLADADRITPRQLLQHTSGLAEYLSEGPVAADPTRKWTPAELIDAAEGLGRTGEPGGPHRYSNTNYIVLGEIIEAVTGNHWFDEVDARIITPLGLEHTTLIDGAGSQATGYASTPDGLADSTYSHDPSTGGAAGQMASTSSDLARFVAAIADGTLLDDQSVEQMTSFVPAEDLSSFGVVEHGYGLGIEIYRTGEVTVIGHLGSGQAHSAFAGYDPDTGAAVAVSMNVKTPGPQAVMAIEAAVALRRP
jgi:D-alanyl-D-alanine carboxypeptidase